MVNVRRRWYLLAWDTTREDWRTLRLDRMRLVDGYAGAAFEPRPLPAPDIPQYVLDSVVRTPWPYQADLIVQDAAHRLVDRLPPNAVIEPVIEPVAEHVSRVRLSADSPRHLAPWLSMLEADFRLADPERDAELAEQIKKVRGEVFIRSPRMRDGRRYTTQRSGPWTLPGHVRVVSAAVHGDPPTCPPAAPLTLP